MVFTLSVPAASGADPARLLSMTLNLQDPTGGALAWNSAFTNLYLLDGTGVTFNVSAVSTSSFTMPVSVGGFVVGPPPASIPVTLIGDIAASASVTTAQVALQQAVSVTAQDDITLSPVGISSNGDPTGFPMLSGVMAFENGDLASTYGNYPNPFHPGTQSTTIEFYLASPSTASLVLYDVAGNKVVALLDHQTLGAGLQRILWNGANGVGATVLSGIYYAQLDVNGTKLLLKIAVVK